MPLYFTRHAKQTRHSLDPPIKFTPAKLGQEFDVTITSPYRRTRETSLALYNGVIHVDTRISEYHCDKNYIKSNYDEETLEYGDLPSLNESWEDFTTRVDSFVEEYINFHKKILVVTHGIVVNYLIEKYHGSTPYNRARDVPFAKITLVLPINK